MDVNDVISGFSVTCRRSLPELKAVLWELSHRATGARLIWLDRPEENKTFSIAFQTQPWDDTGVFHILEHSVLGGSERYPVKEPFLELMKSSMKTFLNAMTFPDKTVYPVSSRNSKDFMNLTRVYLDAVFCPAIHTKREIFEQEGWHYELDDEGNPSYKGIVFNEMKGAYADPETLETRALNAALFPQTCYRFESGGDPVSIPDLTYEDFTAAHRRLYHPANAYIFLDGAVDLDALLAVLDGEYLSRFSPADPPAPIPLQPPVDGGTVELEYELGADEDPARRTRLTWGRVAGTFDQKERLTALRVLCGALAGDNQAPLNRAILSQGLAESVSMHLEDELLQPYLTLEVKNFAAGDLDRVNAVLTGTLEALVRDGLDRPRLLAALANLEFKLRERDSGSTVPQGVLLAIQAMDTWLYGGDPADALEVGDLFTRLREKVDRGYFESLIREVLLDGPHRCQVILTPSKTAGDARRQAEADRLAAQAARWTDADRTLIRQRQDALERWQHSEDTPQQLATLPALTPDDVSPEPETVPTEVAHRGGLPLLLHPVATSGISYVSLYFDAADCAGEDLSALSFASVLLGRLSTDAHSAKELADLKRLLCGVLLHFDLAVHPSAHGSGFRVLLTARLSALEHNLPAAMDLAVEILTRTRWDEEDAARELLRQEKTALFQEIVNSGDDIALGRIRAQLTSAGVADECRSGLDYYRWLALQEERWDWPALSARLARLLRSVAVRCRLTVSVTGEPRQADTVLSRLEGALPNGDHPIPAVLTPRGVCREGIAIPADISFAAAGGILPGGPRGYSGAHVLGARIISLSYLWNVIRVQGGAYGCGLPIRPNGWCGCYSYRDPTAARSLEKYREAGGFLRRMAASGADLTGFIIGAVAAGEPLLTPRLKGAVADAWYWSGTTDADRRAWRRQLLEAQPAQLTAFADALEEALDRGGVCVVGSRPQLDLCALDAVHPL